MRGAYRKLGLYDCYDTEGEAYFRPATWDFAVSGSGSMDRKNASGQVSLGSTAPGAWLAIVA